MKQIFRFEFTIDSKQFYLDGSTIKSAFDHKIFTLKKFNAPILVNIPEENNYCSNWNSSFNLHSHIQIKLNNAKISLESISHWLNAAKSNEDFLIATGVEFDPEYFKVKDFYTELYSVVSQLAESVRERHEYRNIQLKIVL